MNRLVFRQPTFLLAFVLIVGLAAGCGGNTADTGTTPEGLPSNATADTLAADAGGMMAQDAAVLGVYSQEPYGEYLVDGENMTLYMFTADSQGVSSACYNDCAQAWPPLLTTGDPKVAAPAVDSTLVGTIQREDGSTQVTYNGWPLYYFVQDTAATQVSGQDVHGFGGEWYLISPSGEMIEATAGGSS